jgi:LmbE family N-acetylglucosaminyl deacetylase
MSTIVAVFSHPDDEAFGPGGTLASLALNNDVYVLCATKGEAGSGIKGKKLGEIRSSELVKSASVLGVKKVIFLGFNDGDLSNNLYHKLANRIEKELKAIKPDSLLTFEPRGVSGHIDHVVVSLVTTFLFYKHSEIKDLWYFCFSEEQRKYHKDYFVYMPPGYDRKSISKVVDVSGVWEKRLEAAKAHKSQKEDLEYMLKFLEEFPKEEYFLVLKK